MPHPPKSFEQRLQECEAFRIKFDKWPASNAEEPKERALGKWRAINRRRSEVVTLTRKYMK